MSVFSIEQYLEQKEQMGILRFSTAGSIDDGKSTLIGRLLHDAKALFDDNIATVKRDSLRMGGIDIDYSLLTDGLKAEREQKITIDVAYRYFSTPKRKFIIADTPGHEQYTRNMATGASTADLAVILVDARNGVQIQTKRHAFISSLLGVPHMVVAVNKMDLVQYREDVFAEIQESFVDFSRRLKIADLRFIPVSALNGDNVVFRSEAMLWYKGESLLELLENLYIASDRNLVDFRFPVQCVLRPHQNFRGYSGQVASGIMRQGDEVLVLPSMKANRIKSIFSSGNEVDVAYCPMSVTVVLEKEVDVGRGDMLVHSHNLPHIEKHFEATLVWMDDSPMDIEKAYLLKIGTRTERVRIDEVRYRIDVNTLSREDSKALVLNEIGRVAFSAMKPIYYDSYTKNRSSGCFILIDTMSNNTVAAGMMIDREPPDRLPSATGGNSSGFSVASRVDEACEERHRRVGYRPRTIWISGQSMSTKQDLAHTLEKRLFDLGCFSMVLDESVFGNDVHNGANTVAGGAYENGAKIGMMARVLNKAGVISICVFPVSFDEDMDAVAHVVGCGTFLSVDVCTKAASRDCVGAIPNWNLPNTGMECRAAVADVDAEITTTERIIVEYDDANIDKAVAAIIAYVRGRGLFF